MNVTDITAAQFQALFFRNFPYLPTYDATVTYPAGATVFYGSSFWKAIQNGLLDITPGTDSAKWQQFACNPLEYILDQDITNAFSEAQALFNEGLWPDNQTITLAYLYLTAHYLVNDLRAASQSLNSTGSFPVTSRTVGSMSESYLVPDMYKDYPQLAFLTTTSYGMKYLSMLLPNLVGNIVAVDGGTSP